MNKIGTKIVVIFTRLTATSGMAFVGWGRTVKSHISVEKNPGKLCRIACCEMKSLIDASCKTRRIQMNGITIHQL